MTATTVDDAKKPLVVESPSLFRTWWRNKNLQYEIVMSTILIILNIATFLYMKHQKIHVEANQEHLMICVYIYFMFCLASFVSWCIALTKGYNNNMYLLGRICHIFGLAILLALLASISPSLALWFGIPSWLWFFAAFYVPLLQVLDECGEECGEEFGDWLKPVNEEKV